jgi:hypothetical protein
MIALRSVLLPAPFGPHRQTNSPFGIQNETLSTMRRPRITTETFSTSSTCVSDGSGRVCVSCFAECRRWIETGDGASESFFERARASASAFGEGGCSWS